MCPTSEPAPTASIRQLPDEDASRQRGIMKGRIFAQLNAGIAMAMVIALAITGTAWWITQQFEHAVNEQHRHGIRATVALAEAESALWQLRYNLPRYMMGDTEERRRILEEEVKLYEIIDARLNAYATATLSNQEAEGLADLRAQYLRYKEARPKFFNLYGTGRTEEAVAWRALTTTPYGAAAVKAFQRLIQLQRAEAAERGRKQIELLQRNRIIMMAMSGLLLLLLGLGYWMAIRALRPIRELQAEAQRVVHEQLGETLQVDANSNEVVALVKSFKMMTNAFISRATALSQADKELQRQRDVLEQTVAVRTSEFESANRMLAARDRQNQLITEMTGLLQTVHDLDEAARILPRFLEPLFEPHAGALYTVKPSLNYLESIVQWGELTFAPKYEFSECWALRRGKAYAVDKSGFICPHSAAHPAEAYLCAPMISQGVIFGLLHLAYTSPAVGDTAGRERREHARHVIEQLTLALANLRLREALRNQATRDALTSLFNRRYLEEALDRELARAEREGRTLSLLMLDVDHFKRFNDANGHAAGDAVLRSLGRVLAENLRAGDIACRFGGEEFAILLPDDGIDKASACAERLLDRVSTMTVYTRGQTLPPVTISIGLACYPRDGGDVDTLLKAADVALYEAKRAGRNRLVVADKTSPTGSLGTPCEASDSIVPEQAPAVGGISVVPASVHPRTSVTPEIASPRMRDACAGTSGKRKPN